MTVARAQFDGYDVELDTTGHTYGVTHGVCFIRTRGFVGGLRHLVNEGYLEGGSDELHYVPPHVIEQVQKWATNLGYIV